MDALEVASKLYVNTLEMAVINELNWACNSKQIYRVVHEQEEVSKALFKIEKVLR